jgi:hypothetical protein
MAHPIREAGVRPTVTAALLALALAMLAPATAGVGLTGTAGAGITGAAGSSDLPAPGRTARPMAHDPRLLLPGDGAVPGWRRAEEPRVFNGKTLFAHIDGGAEEFLAQGFRALGVGGYRTDSLEIVAEIYDLGSRRGATAILRARGGPAGNGSASSDGGGSSPAHPDSITKIPPAVGEACVLDSLQVLFRRDGFYVAVTGFEAKPRVTTALRVLADSIDARIRVASGTPAGK